MGCNNIKTEGYYSNHQYEEEAILRKFEEEELKCFKKPLIHILHRCIIEQELLSIPIVEEMAIQEFGEVFLKFLRQGYFNVEQNGKKYYDAQKIKLFIFLESNANLITNGKTEYYDKSGFIFNFIKTRDDEDLSSPIEMENEIFVNFINILVDISCVGIVDSWMQLKKVQREGNICHFKNIKDQIAKLYIEKLFAFSSESEAKILTFADLNKKFEKNPLLFTSGDIREGGWKMMNEGLANEVETQKRNEIRAENEKGKKTGWFF